MCVGGSGWLGVPPMQVHWQVTMRRMGIHTQVESFSDIQTSNNKGVDGRGVNLQRSRQHFQKSLQTDHQALRYIAIARPFHHQQQQQASQPYHTSIISNTKKLSRCR